MSPRMFRTSSSIVSSLSSRCLTQFEFPLTAFVMITTGVFWEIRLFSEKRTVREKNHLWAHSCSCKRHTFFHSISLQLFSFCTLSSPLTFFTHDYPPCGISPVKSDFFLRNGLLVSRITLWARSCSFLISLQLFFIHTKQLVYHLLQWSPQYFTFVSSRCLFIWNIK